MRPPTGFLQHFAVHAALADRAGPCFTCRKAPYLLCCTAFIGVPSRLGAAVSYNMIPEAWP